MNTARSLISTIFASIATIAIALGLVLEIGATPASADGNPNSRPLTLQCIGCINCDDLDLPVCDPPNGCDPADVFLCPPFSCSCHPDDGFVHCQCYG